MALFAVAVFAASGSQLVPLLLAGDPGSIPHGQVTAFLLNIALILFAWRRSQQLVETSVERDAAQVRAYNLEYYDVVTGLFNRRRLNEHLAELCARRDVPVTLILIDLDHFKKINDLYGHAVGDELLVIVARRLADACGDEATCYRMGGDEFAVVRSGPCTAGEAERLAEALQVAVTKPVHVAGTVTSIGVSIGIAALNKECREPAGLLGRADIAMYEAKRLGRNRYASFDSRMERELEHRNATEAEIRSGLANGEFVPYFQPIIDLDTGEVRGFEVLARWQHPKRGLLEPAEFIDLAEATGMISDLSFGVMHQALAIARSWPDRFKIAVNVSPVQFNDPLIAQRILKVLSATGFPARRLELEIMERSLLDDPETAIAILTSLKNSGIGVSVDDFGTGYAALTRLRELPFDRIKLDRGFMGSLIEEGRCDALVQAVSTLGKGLKLPITAEGVETETVQARLAELGCTDAQGWLFAKALSAEEVHLGFSAQLAAGPTVSPDEQAFPESQPTKRRAG